MNTQKFSTKRKTLFVSMSLVLLSILTAVTVFAFNMNVSNIRQDKAKVTWDVITMSYPTERAPWAYICWQEGTSSINSCTSNKTYHYGSSKSRTISRLDCDTTYTVTVRQPYVIINGDDIGLFDSTSETFTTDECEDTPPSPSTQIYCYTSGVGGYCYVSSFDPVNWSISGVIERTDSSPSYKYWMTYQCSQSGTGTITASGVGSVSVNCQ